MLVVKCVVYDLQKFVLVVYLTDTMSSNNFEVFCEYLEQIEIFGVENILLMGTSQILEFM